MAFGFYKNQIIIIIVIIISSSSSSICLCKSPQMGWILSVEQADLELASVLPPECWGHMCHSFSQALCCYD